MNRTLAIVCGVLVLIAGIVWFALPDDEAGATVPPVTPVTAPAAGGETVRLDDVTRPSAEAPSAAGEGRAELAPAEGDWIVRGVVLTGYREPRPGSKLLAEILSADLSETLLEEELVADAEGGFRWPLSAPAQSVTLRVTGNEPGTKSSPATRGVELGDPAPQDLEVRVYPQDLTIEGTVRGPDGPLADADVFGGSVETTTDDEGHYSLVTTSARSSVYLFAQSAGYAQMRASVPVQGQAGKTLRADFDLVRALPVAGRVVDEQGAPVAGATVDTFYAQRNTAITGADGRFVLDHLDPRREDQYVYARKDGYVQASTQVESGAVPIDDLELVLRVGARVEGIVLAPDGTPLPGAELYIGFSVADYNRLDAVSDADGTFVFPHVDSGEQTLHAEHDDYAPARRVLSIPAGARFVDPVELRFVAGRTVTGVVRDGAGSPLARVNVAVQQRGEYVEGGTKTDEEGRFRLEALPVEGLSLEFWSMRTVRKDVPVPPDLIAPLEVVLEETGVVAGRVVDGATGEPVPEFTVRFVRGVLQEGEEEIGGYSATWAREGKRFTSPDGTWSADGEEIRAGTVVGIEVRAEGYGAAVAPHVVVQEQVDHDALVIRLAPPAAVYGLVVDHLNAPLAGVRVIARPVGAAPPYWVEEVHEIGIGVTDDEGAFRLDGLPPGEMMLYVSPPERPGFKDGPFTLRAGDAHERLLRVPEGGTLRGRVLAGDGSPLAGVLVHLSTPDWAGEWPQYHQADETSDAEGRFAFHGLPDSRYQVSRIEVEGEERLFALVVVTAVVDGEGFALLQAKGSATIRGRVELDGAPPASLVRVSFLWREPPGGSRPEIRPATRSTFARDGVFEIGDLEPGSYVVSCYHFEGSTRLFAHTDATVGEGEAAEVLLELEDM